MMNTKQSSIILKNMAMMERFGALSSSPDEELQILSCDAEVMLKGGICVLLGW